MPYNFKKLQNIVLDILKSGRPNWDIPHTLASVYWMKKLLRNEKANEKILISTMYLHDIGYSRSKGDFNTRHDTVLAKSDHMKNGVKIARPILDELDYTKKEKEKILHLISVHDNIEKLKTKYEKLVFEADSLAQIDIQRAKSNFKGSDRHIFIDRFIKERAKLFKTKTGKHFLSKLLPKAEKFYNNK